MAQNTEREGKKWKTNKKSEQKYVNPNVQHRELDAISCDKPTGKEYENEYRDV